MSKIDTNEKSVESRASENVVSTSITSQKIRDSVTKVTSEGFGTKARNVAKTMAVGDIVVPFAGSIGQRQVLANKGIYHGVEYIVSSLIVRYDDGEKEIKSMSEAPADLSIKVEALIKPAYKLRKHLERTDWPVPINPIVDVPLWVSKSTYQAGTMIGTAALALSYLLLATFLSFFVKFVFVPTESMVPALNPGNVILVSRSLPFKPFEPKVDDIVLFDPPSELEESLIQIENSENAPDNISKIGKGQKLLKRVVAVPGEVVGVKNSEPYVLLNGPYLNKNTFDAKSTVIPEGKRKFRVDIVGPYSRPEMFSETSWDRPAEANKSLKRNEFFVVGDNGFRSVDSRVWGPLRSKYIFGVARWVFWPVQDFGPIKPGQIYEIEK